MSISYILSLSLIPNVGAKRKQKADTKKQTDFWHTEAFLTYVLTRDNKSQWCLQFQTVDDMILHFFGATSNTLFMQYPKILHLCMYKLIGNKYYDFWRISHKQKEKYIYVNCSFLFLISSSSITENWVPWHLSWSK